MSTNTHRGSRSIDLEETVGLQNDQILIQFLWSPRLSRSDVQKMWSHDSGLRCVMMATKPPPYPVDEGQRVRRRMPIASQASKCPPASVIGEGHMERILKRNGIIGGGSTDELNFSIYNSHMPCHASATKLPVFDPLQLISESHPG